MPEKSAQGLAVAVATIQAATVRTMQTTLATKKLCSDTTLFARQTALRQGSNSLLIDLRFAKSTVSNHSQRGVKNGYQPG